MANKNEATPVVGSDSQLTNPVASVNDCENYKLKASMVGLVYFAPGPDKPAYKAVGDHIKRGETLCAIEAMKLINEVKSPVTGTITKRLVNDGEMVEFDQPMFEIKED